MNFVVGWLWVTFSVVLVCFLFLNCGLLAGGRNLLLFEPLGGGQQPPFGLIKC